MTVSKANYFFCLIIFILTIQKVSAQKFSLATGFNWYHVSIGDMSGTQQYGEIAYDFLPRFAIVGRVNNMKAHFNQLRNGEFANTENLLTIDHEIENYPYLQYPSLVEFGFNNDQDPNTNHYLSTTFDLNLRYHLIKNKVLNIQIDAGGSYANSQLTYVTAIVPSEVSNLFTGGQPQRSTIIIPYYLKYNELAWNIGFSILLHPTERFSFGVNATTHINDTMDAVSLGGKVAVSF